jgi:hypothetical protein
MPSEQPRSFSLLPVVALIAVAIAVAAFMYVKRGDQSAAVPAAAAQSAQSKTPPRGVPEINRSRIREKSAAASVAGVSAAAADGGRPRGVASPPSIRGLSYVPCFCGCERGGHRGNEDCFVTGRDKNGDVTQWEPHGLDCAVCIDVATQARQMFTSGASISDIRSAVEKKYAGFSGGHTPTPQPPPSK